jgi:hypothetical protein
MDKYSTNFNKNNFISNPLTNTQVSHSQFYKKASAAVSNINIFISQCNKNKEKIEQ